MLFISGTIIILLFSKEKKAPKPENEFSSNSSPTQALTDFDTKNAIKASGIITQVDLDSSSISIRVLPGQKEDITSPIESLELIYTGASDIRTKYNKPISATQLKPGDIVNVNYSEDFRLLSLCGSDMIWRYKNIENLQIDDNLRKITLGDKVYRYDDSLLVLCEDTFLTLDDLSKLDMLNLYGIDNYVYVIKVINGHGYLSLANYSSFIGGTLSIGHGRTETITEDMKVLLEEGEYEILAEKDGYTASAIVKISNAATSYFDLAGQGAAPVANGTVHFNISPAESDLYVDGVKTFHSAPVTLSYGDHTIEAVLGGYNDYKGSINVNRSDISLNISLSPKTLPDPEEDVLYEDNTDNSEELDNSDFSNNTDDNSNDNEDESSPVDSIPDSTTDDSDYSSLPEVDGDSDDNSDSSDNNDDTTPTNLPEDTINNNPEGNSTDTGNNTDSTDTDNTGNNSDSSDNDNTGNNSDSTDNNNTGSTSDSTDNDNTGSNTDSIDNTTDTRKVIIYCNNGVSVYADNTYIGVIDGGNITFNYRPDTITIRLEKDGYITKNYTITIDPDEAESTFKFPDLTKSEK